MQVLTQSEAAAMLCLKPNTLAKWRFRRTGPAFLKLGGKIRYRMADLEKWIEAHRIDPSGPLLPARGKKAA